MNQRSGRPAEKEFASLCAQKEITCNRADEDDHGWDYIIEIPAPNLDKLPADKVSSPKPIFIQVKSTKGKHAATTIKVSNAIKFANNEIPCFIVLFQNTSEGRRHIFVRHYWKELIELSLERGRQVSVEGKPTNKSKLKITFSDQDEHSDDLVEWLIETVNAFPKGYGKEKLELAEKLGYEGKGGQRAKFTFAESVTIEDLIDAQLGLIEFLPVKHIKVTDSRFGIDSPVPDYEGPGSISLKPDNPKKCKLVIQNSNNDIISLPSTIKFPSIPNLSEKKFKCLVENWLLSLTMPYSGQFICTVSDFWKKKLTCERLYELALFLSFGGDEISIRIVDDGPPLHISADMGFEGDETDFKRYSNFIKTLQEILLRAGANELLFSLDDLYKGKEEVAVFHEILSTAENIEINSIYDPNWEYSDNVFSNILAYCDINLGGVTFLVVFSAPVLEQKAQDTRIKWNCGERKWLYCVVGEDADSVLLEGQTEYEKISNEYGEEYLGFGRKITETISRHLYSIK